MPAARDAVTLVELLEVTGPFDEAVTLLQTVLARLEHEGVSGLASMQFYADEPRRHLGVIITFSDPAQLLAHTAQISGWDEFRRFSAMFNLLEMRIHGAVSPEVRAWIARFEGTVTTYPEPVAAFFRPRAER